ncbi:hypothetical protein CYMTET_38317 [Cymbomonas tetramitiformis]|uniref:Uncharacterized protein n=1 Tax=Cymbomonas tetramitiformis TaxID=36881 RepID=A0AAE0CCB2_9CHLO|nr:hypothetical protein CYMTET_38317 [Cymbomonas tetramitiformis]
MSSIRRASPEDKSDSEEKEEDLPPWVKREQQQAASDEGGFDLPYGVYLLLSAILIIAVIGSCFELAYKNPIFGVVESDSPLYYPILGVFIVTGPFSAASLWKKAIKSANDFADEQDRLDGY